MWISHVTFFPVFDKIRVMIKQATILTGILFPGILFAQSQIPIDYAGPISILTFYSLISAVALGVVTSIIVLINGRRMKGGILGGALTSLGIGMFIVLAGTITYLFPSLVPGGMQGVFPNILNTVGYVVMAIAASRLLKVTSRT